MARDDIEGFLSIMGHEFCNVLKDEAGIADASGHDCYSALVDALGVPISADVLRQLRPEQFVPIADAFNAYFESTSVTSSHVAKAVSATLSNWP